MANIFTKILKACKEGRLSSLLYSRIKFYLYGIRESIGNPASRQISLHCPDYIEPSKDKDELEIIERIFQSFRKMKEAEKKSPVYYLPSSLWQEQLDKSYFHLTSGLKTNDINKFHFFLANFGTWKSYHGVESATLIRDNMTSFVRRQYLKSVIFYKQLKIWKWFYNNRKSISNLTYPAYGNQAGAYIDNVFIGVGSFFNEIYGSLLNGLIKDTKHPVVADLGAGYGKLAYFTLRGMDNFTFIDFDLPETLCLAAYYLMKTWPNKKVLLFGEGDYSSEKHGQYDLIFMPAYEICKIDELSVDLFINKNSLGEMTKEAVVNYIYHITRATRYFFHMNHDIRPNVYSNNDRGLLGYEYPVPADKFKLLFRYPDIGHILYQGGVDFNADIFLYLYERINSG
ncbi:MAG: putative sugar O-methyltransferase [Candidatus Omnitrophota bacterium]|nr:putative sugar O-methyltransferase [Candidatus Omnitrophota bacterium]